MANKIEDPTLDDLAFLMARYTQLKHELSEIKGYVVTAQKVLKQREEDYSVKDSQLQEVTQKIGHMMNKIK